MDLAMSAASMSRHENTTIPSSNSWISCMTARFDWQDLTSKSLICRPLKSPMLLMKLESVMSSSLGILTRKNVSNFTNDFAECVEKDANCF